MDDQSASDLFRLQGLDFEIPEWLDDGLFFKSANAIREKGVLACPAGGSVDLNTYFGAFPVQFWREKCDLRDLHLEMVGTGTVDLEVSAFGERGDLFLMEKHRIDLSRHCSVDLNAMLRNAFFLISVKIESVESFSLHSLSFLTRSAALRAPSIGIVITTFHREDEVQSSIARISRFIEKNDLTNSMHLCVVDNGSTLADTFPQHHITLIPNENTGGAGGFARGLSFFQDRGTCSHVIFMDDDASTIDETLSRTLAFLSRCCDERTAITAAMLRKEATTQVHEQGALFQWGRDHRIISRKHGLDLLNKDHLLEMIREEAIEYGGWWYYVFPINGAVTYPYPMFVRGDDWLFSYLNDFNLVAMLGVGSWQEGFEGKLSPTEQYLAMKAFVAAEVILRHPIDRWMTTRFFAGWIFNQIAGYCYDRAELSYHALRDVERGPAFWADNVKLGERLGSLRKLVTAETLVPATQASNDAPGFGAGRRLSRLSRFFRKISLNGILLPNFILSKPAVRVDRYSAPFPRAAFGRPRVIYSDGVVQFDAKRNRMRAIGLYVKSAIFLIRLYFLLPALQAHYRASIPSYCSKRWWDEIGRASRERAFDVLCTGGTDVVCLNS